MLSVTTIRPVAAFGSGDAGGDPSVGGNLPSNGGDRWTLNGFVTGSESTPVAA
ncbi:MAG: hypothetical protein ABEJ79_12045 [Halolamina sp.]